MNSVFHGCSETSALSHHTARQRETSAHTTELKGFTCIDTLIVILNRVNIYSIDLCNESLLTNGTMQYLSGKKRPNIKQCTTLTKIIKCKHSTGRENCIL